MNTVDFLVNLAGKIPNTTWEDQSLNIQSDVIKAIETNNGEMIKKLISDKHVYANQTKVTTY